jgi:hypothetical protein
MTSILFSLVLSLALQASAEGPLHQGLPDTLPADFVQSGGFVEFQTIPGGARAPLGFSFFFNNREVLPTDFQALAEVFSEGLYARLPPGTRIVSTRDSQGRTVWDYPVGTRAIHLVTLTDAAKSLFELRLIEKQDTGQWAYGIYSPAAAPGLLALDRTEQPDPLSFAVERTDGKRIDVSMRRVNIRSCRRCHFMNSASRHQYPNDALAGPCHFVPDNGPGIAQWVRKYVARHGESPLEPAPLRRLRPVKP